MVRSETFTDDSAQQKVDAPFLLDFHDFGSATRISAAGCSVFSSKDSAQMQIQPVQGRAIEVACPLQAARLASSA